MALKPLLFIFIFIGTFIGAIFITPFIGLCGYIMSYNLNPIGFWWGKQLPEIFQRYSLLFFLACLGGMIVHWSKLRYRHLLEGQEILLILFILIIWISTLTGVPSHGLGENSLKMTKVCIILLVASHLVTNLKYYNIMVWIYILSGLYSGFEIFNSDSLSFIGGRLQSGVGGSDFSEGNFLAAHYLIVLPWIGIYFLKGKLRHKCFCLFAAVFIVNSLILIESRGAFLAILAGGITALIVTGKKYRNKIVFLLLLGLAGFIYLSDTTFWTRMNTIDTNESTMGRSAGGRIEAWKVAIEMFNDYPYGVGEGNFKILAGLYNPDAEGRDTHNTFFRCLAELGLQGLVVLLFMIYMAFKYLKMIQNSININTQLGQEYSLHILALRISLVMYIVTTCFLSHTYVEEFYWVLMFPLFLKRCYENEFE